MVGEEELTAGKSSWRRLSMDLVLRHLSLNLENLVLSLKKKISSKLDELFFRINLPAVDAKNRALAKRYKGFLVDKRCW